MLKRTISGIIMFIIVTACVLWGARPFAAILLFCSMVAVFEMSRAFGIHDEDKPLNITEAIMYLATIGIYATGIFCTSDNVDKWVMVVLVTMILLQLSNYVLTFPKLHASDITAAIFIVIYAPYLLSFGYRIEAFTGHPYIYTALIFIVSSASDVFAYFVGVNLGKHKLAPVLSPKKSIEGAVGAIVLTSISCVIYVVCLHMAGYMELSYIFIFAIIGAVGSIISQIGDLAASAIKRNFNIKDYGRLIPGHGGIMDRVDSWIITMPIIYIILLIIGETV